MTLHMFLLIDKKIMGPHGMLNDNSNIAVFKDGTKLTLIGTADELSQKPDEKVVFLEDLVEEDQKIASGDEISKPGLVNLGNTCYMNSCLQSLHSVKELEKSLVEYKPVNMESDLSEKITGNLKNLFQALDKPTSTAFTPAAFVNSFRTAYPRFSQTENSPVTGQQVYLQQDADEFLNTLLQLLSTKFSSNKLVDNLFRGEFETTFQNIEAKEEHSVITEGFLKLPCQVNQEVLNLEYGLKRSLTETIEKHSDVLNKNATFTKTSRISHLPPYLVINFWRFFWKQKEQLKAKLLRDVKFPMILDVYEVCTDALKQHLKPNREYLLKKKDDEIMASYEKTKATSDGESTSAKPNNNNSGKSVESSTAISGSSSSSVVVGEQSKITATSSTTDKDVVMIEGENENSSGWYELFAVITHKGRSVDSGHYVSWVKVAEGKWVKCDDDKVTSQNDEDIKKLSGGGDWHCAYILFYRSRKPDGSPVVK